MKSLMLLWQIAAEEFGSLCSVSTTRDFETVTSRVEHEGLSFLTITLPQFGADLQRALSEERVSPNLFQGFARQASLPLFLGGFLDLVFDRKSGVLVDSPSIEAIQALRQLSLQHGKLEVPTTDRRRRAAIKGFIDAEAKVKEGDASRTTAERQKFRQVSRLIWGEVLQRVDNSLYREHAHAGGSFDPDWPYVIPKHGPGATADRKSGNRKYDFTEWSQRLEKTFPFGEYAIPNWRYYNLIDRVDFREPGAERPVRVVDVPKTLKAPRIIAIEPSYMQFVQQGLKEMIVGSIRRDYTMGRIVGFDDQWRNNRLAEEGSRKGTLATLDLSEASDRVSNQLVRDLVSPWPHLYEALDATRSRSADVPGFGKIRLAKYASMGSALTFPVEAMVFTTVIFIGIEKSLGHPLTRRDVKSLRKRVRVYGDDLIVPVEFAEDVIVSLEAYGFKVNSNKSYVTGLFRESCGKEYYAGHDVSVVRVRAVTPTGDSYDLPSSRRFVRETESTIALRNRFYLNGLWKTAAWLDRWNMSLLGGHYPTLEVHTSVPWEEPTPRSRLLGRWSVLSSPLPHPEEGRYHPDYQVPLMRGWVVKNQIPDSQVSGVGALLKTLSPRKVEPFEDEKHLERAGRPDAVRILLRWTTYL